MPNPKSCTHIKVTGVRCKSPALLGEQFCYFHQNAYRGVRRPSHSRLHPIALIESEEAIQASLMEVINGLIRNTLDVKRAELILRALHIAVKNARNTHLDSDVYPKVRQVPQYAEPDMTDVGMASHVGTGVSVTAADPLDDFLPAVAAVPYKPVDPRDPHFLERFEEGGRVLAREAADRRAAATQAAVVVEGKVHVGTAAPGCPGRAATVPAANAVKNARVKPQPSAAPAPTLPHPPHLSNAGKPEPKDPQRKPPRAVKADAKTTAAPKEQKNAAQRASAG